MGNIREARLKSENILKGLGYRLIYTKDSKSLAISIANQKYSPQVLGYQPEWFDDYHPVVYDKYFISQEVIDHWPEVFEVQDGKAKLLSYHILANRGIQLIGWSDDGEVIKLEQQSPKKDMFYQNDIRNHWHKIYPGCPISHLLVKGMFSNVFETR